MLDGGRTTLATEGRGVTHIFWADCRDSEFLSSNKRMPLTTSFTEVRNRKGAESGLFYHWTASAVLATLPHQIWLIEHKCMEVNKNEFLNNDTIIYEGLKGKAFPLAITHSATDLLRRCARAHHLIPKHPLHIPAVEASLPQSCP